MEDNGPMLLKLIFERTCPETSVDIVLLIDNLGECMLKNYDDDIVSLFTDIEDLYNDFMKNGGEHPFNVNNLFYLFCISSNAVFHAYISRFKND